MLQPVKHILKTPTSLDAKIVSDKLYNRRRWYVDRTDPWRFYILCELIPEELAVIRQVEKKVDRLLFPREMREIINEIRIKTTRPEIKWDPTINPDGLKFELGRLIFKIKFDDELDDFQNQIKIDDYLLENQNDIITPKK